MRRILAELGGGPVTVLATGGLAPPIAQASETITIYVPELTLLGLRLIFESNPAGSRPDMPDRLAGHDR